MKRFICLTLAVCLVFIAAGCSDQEHPKDFTPSAAGKNYIFSTDFQKGFHSGAQAALICESDTGHYFLLGTTGEGFLYYTEKGSAETTPVCGKPECAHDTTDCNAWLEADNIAWHNGKLYYAAREIGVSGNDIYLYSMNPDGTGRTKIQTIVKADSGVMIGMSGSWFIIHRGYVYYQNGVNIYANKLGDNEKSAVKISDFPENKSPGDSGDVGRNSSFDLTKMSAIWKLYADGENIYYMGNENVGGTYKETLYRFNPQTGENKMVWRVPDEEDVGKWIHSGVKTNGWYIGDGYIYYYLSENGLYRCNLDNGTTDRIAKIDKSSAFGDAVFDGQYAYIENNNYDSKVDRANASATIYTLNGDLVGKIDWGRQYDEAAYFDFWIAGINDTQVFFGATRQFDENHVNQYQSIFYCDKDKLSGGKLEELIVHDWHIDPNEGLE